MTIRHPLLVVLVASIACLAAGFSATPFWDEDEPRFASIAEAMLVTGDWVVPRYNETLAVDKPVLMHWCMATCFAIFGTSEFAARLPSAIATLLTALALLRAGSRWFNATTGVVAALAYVGCLLVGIESHAATPDAILTALCTWATLLVAEAIVPAPGGTAIMRIDLPRAAAVGALLGLGVLCKGPIGFIGPLAVLMPWAWWLEVNGRMAVRSDTGLTFRGLVADGCSAVFRVLWGMRLATITVATIAVAAPWYVLVGVRTAGAWPAGFFFIHNIGRAAAAMENHSGGAWYHPVTMLVGFFPWSCFLPLAIVVAARRLWKRSGTPIAARIDALLLTWIAIWLTGFSIAATKLPNYILPAYPAAALLVAALGVEAASRERWPHPRWLASGLGWLAFGGIATSAAVIATTFFGLEDAVLAAAVGLVPVCGAVACLWYASRDTFAALRAFTVTALVYTALVVGPVGAWLAKGNMLPALVKQAHHHAGGRARLGTFMQNTPNVIYYAHGRVEEWGPKDAAAAAAFLASGPDALVLVPERRFELLADALSADHGVIARARPLFSGQHWLVIGTRTTSSMRTAAKPAALPR